MLIDESILNNDKYNNQKVGSIPLVHFTRGDSLLFIKIYNELVVKFNYSDTITIKSEKGRLVYYYQGDILIDFFNSRSIANKPLKIYGYFGHGFIYMHSLSGILPSTVRELVFQGHQSQDQGGYIELSNYFLDVLTGRYEKRMLNDHSKIEGNYCQMDSIYSEEVELYDPDSGEIKLEKYFRSKFPLKCGIWKYYDEKGRLIKEEQIDGKN